MSPLVGAITCTHFLFLPIVMDHNPSPFGSAMVGSGSCGRRRLSTVFRAWRAFGPFGSPWSRLGSGVCACGLRLPCPRSEHPVHPEVVSVESRGDSASESSGSTHSSEKGRSDGLSPRGATATTASSKGQKRPDEPLKYCYAWSKNFSTCSEKNPDCAPAPDPTPFSCENKTAKR